MSTKFLASTVGNLDGQRLHAEEVISYAARVSNPNNQTNFDTAASLLRYCIKNEHWSVFETASLTIEIVTSRAIAQQILRHRSFTFQEFSQRYAESLNYVEYEARRQDVKNRQSSFDDFPEMTKQIFREYQAQVWNTSYTLYKNLIDRGVAKECARMILPLNTETKLYMTGSVRSWIHYIELRTQAHTQKEHRDIASGIRAIFTEHFPNIAQALGWV